MFEQLSAKVHWSIPRTGSPRSKCTRGVVRIDSPRSYFAGGLSKTAFTGHRTTTHINIYIYIYIIISPGLGPSRNFESEIERF